MSATPTIGVLALQGDTAEHLAVLGGLGVPGTPVTRPERLDDVQGLIIPGGESTTMGKLAVRYELMEPLRKHVGEGMPVYGTCAGMIMLADQVLDGAEGQQTVGGLEMTVRRNAFGRQTESFEAGVHIEGAGEAPSTRCSSAPRGSSRSATRSACSAESNTANGPVGSSPCARVAYWPPHSTPS